MIEDRDPVVCQSTRERDAVVPRRDEDTNR
jgi:hypothetical protein